MSKMTTVEETISHGDTEKVRLIEVDLSDIDSVTEMLNTCSYLRLPDPDFGKGDGVILVSHSYDQIIADRKADAQRIAKDLAKGGEAEIGWVRYEVVS